MKFPEILALKEAKKTDKLQLEETLHHVGCIKPWIDSVINHLWHWCKTPSMENSSVGLYASEFV